MEKQKLFSYHKLIILIFVFVSLNVYAQEVASSGALIYAYPLSLPAGRNGLGPSLSLVYDSNAGNGMLGMGWSLAGFSVITRDTAYDISFNDSTDHFLLDGQRLIKGADGYYHTEKESYARIEHYVSTPDDIDPLLSYWVVTLKNGTKMYYGVRGGKDSPGGTSGGRINAVGKKFYDVLAWCLDKVIDVMGNSYIIEYILDETDGDYYPAKITYNTATVEFSYEERPASDIGVVYVPTLVEMNLRLKFITVRTKECKIIRLYNLNYSTGINTGRSILTGIQEYGSDVCVAMTDPIILPDEKAYGKALPETRFGYSTINGKDCKIQSTNVPMSNSYREYGSPSINKIRIADVNGDGIDDCIVTYRLGIPAGGNNSGHYINSLCVLPGQTNGQFGNSIPVIIEAVDAGELLEVNDINGDGAAEIVVSGGTQYLIYKCDSKWNFNNIGQFGISSLGFGELKDFNGDGKADIVTNDFGDTETIYIAYSTGSGFSSYSSTGLSFNRYNEAPYYADVNGDGKTDVLKYNSVYKTIYISLSKGSSFENWRSQGVSYYVEYENGQIQFADVNGDGKDDLVAVGSIDGYIYIALSKGNKFDEQWTWYSNKTIIKNDEQNSVFFADMNDDGINDLVKESKSGHTLTVYPSNKDGSFKIDSGYFSIDFKNSSSSCGYNEIPDKLGDVNGDGKLDYVFLTSGTINTCLRDNGDITKPDILTSVITASGGTIEITYKPAPQVPGAIDPTKTDTANQKIAFTSPQNLVLSMMFNDGLGNTMQTDYEYSNNMFYTGYMYEREYLGFEYIKKIDHATKAYTKTYFYQDKPFEHLVKMEQLFASNEFFVDANDHEYNETEYKYDYRIDNSDYPDIKFVYKTDDYQRNFNGTDSAIEYHNQYAFYDITYDTIYKTQIITVIQYITYNILGIWTITIPVTVPITVTVEKQVARKTLNSYDSHGNLLHIKNYGNSDPEITDDDTETYIYYTDFNSEKNIIMPKRIEKYGYNTNGDFIKSSEEKYYYDKSDTEGYVADGLLTKKITTNYDADKNDDSVTSTYAYDQYGNLISTRDGRANAGEYFKNTSELTYDDVYKTYIRTVKNVLGHNAITTYDEYMRPHSVTDANGQVSYIKYDEFGRVIAKAKPGDNIESSPAEQTVYYDTIECKDGIITSPTYAQKKVKLDDNKTISTFSYYDGLGRIIQTKTQTANADEWKTIDCYYDESGRNYKTSMQYMTDSSEYSNADESQKCAINEYDTIGRVIKTINTDGTFSQTVYEKQRIVFIDESGHITSKETNGNTNIERLYNGIYTGTVPDSDTAYYSVTTKSAVDGVMITDSIGSTISTNCDMLGRTLSYTDPNMGTWTYTYDKNGNVLTQTDAKGQIISSTYDKLNRIFTKTTSEGTTNYTYDVDTSSGLNYSTGRLVSVNYPDGLESYIYDERGRITKITLTVKGIKRSYEYTYNTGDQLITEKYPTGEVLTYSYDITGNIIKLEGKKDGITTIYANDIGYTTLNKLKQITYGNKIKTTYDYFDENDNEQTENAYSYRLKKINIFNADNNQKIASLSYKYDAVDNVKEKTFSSNDLNYREVFEYDVFNRLLVAGNYNEENSDWLYDAEYFHYSPDNNITFISSPNLRENQNIKYQYNATVTRDGQEVILPHAVSKVGADAGGGYRFSYDENGNVSKTEIYPTITIRAKKTQDSGSPKILLCTNGGVYNPIMVWNVTETQYDDFTYSAAGWSGDAIDIIFENGDDIQADLVIDNIRINGTMIESDSGSVEYITGNGESNPGKKLMTEKSTLRFHVGKLGNPRSREIVYSSDNYVISIIEKINDNGWKILNTSYFAYDSGGTRIYKKENNKATYYFGAGYEEEYLEGSSDPIKCTSYYFVNSQRIAQRTSTTGQDDELIYYHTDHLGS
jgi:YD repeat-containing protein